MLQAFAISLTVLSVTLGVIPIITGVRSSSDCELIGKGGCRGPNWSFEDWPKNIGKKEDCCSGCRETKGCTSYHMTKNKECVLYGHKEIIPAQSLAGNCFRLREHNEESGSHRTHGDEFISSKQCEQMVEKECGGKFIKEPKKPTPEKKKPIKDEPKHEKKSKDYSSKKLEKEVIKEPKKPSQPTVQKKKTQEGHKNPSKEENNKNKKIKKSKGSTSTIDKVGNKYLLKVGEGGCRGDGWSKGEWPKWYANMDTYTCAKACLNSKECTAIHVLERETLEGETLLECLHYNHKKVITVPRLGGNCYKLVDNIQTKDEGKEDDSETIVSFKKPVEIKHLGKGRCRGYLWQSYDNKWPKVSGHLTLKECSEECARFKGCTSFDITEETSNKKADCLLYSHKDIVPANFQKGSCYGLVDRLHSKEKPLKKTQNHGKKDVNTNIDESDNDYEEDELELDEDATYFHQGHGRCRGPNWTIGRKWPKLKGRRSIQGCANSCQLKKGCTGFDISDGSEADQTYECVLYGHKNPAPASSVPGECYKLEFVTEDDNSDENDDEADDLDEAFSNIGDDVEKIDEGACRGENWQNPSQTWPKVKGILMPEECKNECGNTKGCTAFDLSPLDTTANAEGKFNCYLFGHKDVIAASAVPGNCFIFPDAIPNDEENDDYDKKEFKKLGKGLCRGPNWQDKYWPKVGNLVKEEYECFKQCKERGACTAFDVSPSTTPSKLNCFMFGHGEVIPASSLNGDCYKMKGRSARKRSFKAHSTPQVFKGVCRGENWQSLKGWPVEKSSIVLNADDCSEMCEDMNGCTAFDIRNSSGMKICTYYGHKEVKPAAAVPGECYIFPLKDNISDEKKVVEGQTYIGKGACRGPGWAGKKWPKEIKGKRISLKECAQECWSLKGCTAFDLREHDNEIVCTIFGHKNVIPASAVPGDCYAAPKVSLEKSRNGKKTEEKLKKKKPDVEKPKKKKYYKIPEYKEPKVINDEESDDDAEWLFEPPPPEVRARNHIEEILDMTKLSTYKSDKLIDKTLKDLKKTYQSSVEPLETLFKYRELSNRHHGDPEIFANPLIVLMGPWSGGKSTMINYILGTEFSKNAFKAKPSEGFNFNIAMYGDSEEELEGTELAAQFAFSSLQKFGQEFLKKLKGKKMPNQLLKKATFAEIPGVLETGSVRKRDRQYPFNDACQWFIDHADLILLVYDYAKLDIGPETEALLDQLKGRETQVRIILNKADEITADELLKIQGSLVWNVSPLMASMEPPKMYAGSFWSRPYKTGAPKKLLKSQEISLLKDIHQAITKQVENRIATARRFAVRVRNHAKMVDCYLNTYYNHKGYLGDKNKISADIIDNPHKYNIYQGLSTMTNISRYDLPDPENYRYFFNLHPLYDFPTLKSTCTFFKGCPINKLDLAIAYEFPELITAYKKEYNRMNSSSNV
ncbi:uncharacterized protein [Lepeophtheirus salmonis]|uniref:uncharacterized protein isoform X2 n=1 Tax=Lepeophtheirus salmonis TaxID=72036 RepID=UPI001AE7D880|nr:uncharacterized protein LOC121119642 isoform X2 [Lepeophtheirus salmonis]